MKVISVWIWLSRKVVQLTGARVLNVYASRAEVNVAESILEAGQT